MKPQLFHIAVFPALPACCHYPGDSLRSFQDLSVLQVETGRRDVQAHLGRKASKVSRTAFLFLSSVTLSASELHLTSETARLPVGPPGGAGVEPCAAGRLMISGLMTRRRLSDG